ncbi:MAG: cytochrome c [Rhodobacteraceae bacterium]|nr:cytochrome c [Paracoccaceae bacterium]
MKRNLLLGVVALAVLGAGAAWLLTAPQRLGDDVLASLPKGDARQGEVVFWAGGCASCHAAEGAQGDDKLKLGGGLQLVTPFGTFTAPNISPHRQDGIGRWTRAEFANAMKTGTGRAGQHYYPAFPYTSYARMSLEDVADLQAYLLTLPAVAGDAGPHELAFPFNIRRGLGLWKRLYLSDAPVVPEPVSEAGVPVDRALFDRGRYLVEGPGHCGECHTPRNAIGGPDKNRWLAGAAAPTGDGVIPNITPSDNGLGSWTTEDIAYYLETGFTPEFDAVGGEMVAVQENMARLTARDRTAIATYLKAIPTH